MRAGATEVADQPGIVERKREVRAQVRAALGAIGAREARESSRAICDRLAREAALARAACVMVFYALPGEPDLSDAARAVLARGGRLCAPRMDWGSRSITPVLVKDWGAPVEVRRHGVREPFAGEEASLDAIGAVIVPGVAFDAAGGRLGRGGGFYDRFLARVRAAGRAWICGVGFDAQIVDEAPREPHDVRMDAVVTERRTIRPSGR